MHSLPYPLPPALSSPPPGIPETSGLKEESGSIPNPAYSSFSFLPPHLLSTGHRSSRGQPQEGMPPAPRASGRSLSIRHENSLWSTPDRDEKGRASLPRSRSQKRASYS